MKAETVLSAVVDRWVMYADASGNERPAHVVRETKIDGVTVLGVEAAGPGLVWVPIDRVIRSAATQLDLVPADALNALAGTWPGDETDEELASAMRDWDGPVARAMTPEREAEIRGNARLPSCGRDAVWRSAARDLLAELDAARTRAEAAEAKLIAVEAERAEADAYSTAQAVEAIQEVERRAEAVQARIPGMQIMSSCRATNANPSELAAGHGARPAGCALGWTPQEREGGHGALDPDERPSSGGLPLAPGAASDRRRA